MVVRTFRKNSVPRYQDGDTIANAETGGTRWTEKGILHALEGSLPMGIEGAAEVGEDLLNHGDSWRNGCTCGKHQGKIAFSVRESAGKSEKQQEKRTYP